MNAKTSKLLRKVSKSIKVENESKIITRKKYQNIKREFNKLSKDKRHITRLGFKELI